MERWRREAGEEKLARRRRRRRRTRRRPRARALVKSNRWGETLKPDETRTKCTRKSVLSIAFWLCLCRGYCPTKNMDQELDQELAVHCCHGAWAVMCLFHLFLGRRWAKSSNARAQMTFPRDNCSVKTSVGSRKASSPSKSSPSVAPRLLSVPGLRVSSPQKVPVGLKWNTQVLVNKLAFLGYLKKMGLRHCSKARSPGFLDTTLAPSRTATKSSPFFWVTFGWNTSSRC